MKNREKSESKHPRLSLFSDAHRPTQGCPPNSSLAQRSLLATGQFSWLKVHRKIPFGFRRRAVRKVITALLPASLLPAAVSGGSFSSKYGKMNKKPCKVTKSNLLLAFVTVVVVFTWFPFFFVSCRYEPSPLEMFLKCISANKIIFVLPSAQGTIDIPCWQAGEDVGPPLTESRMNAWM